MRRNVASGSRRRSRFRRDLGLLFVGAILGNLTAGPTDRAISASWEAACGGEAYLRAGKELRERALILKDRSANVSADRGEVDDLHRQANASFQAGASCGNAFARAYLGQGYCYGWGVERDRAKGFLLIVEAHNASGRFERWLTQDKYCPRQMLAAK